MMIVIIVFTVLALDQFSKYLITNNLSLHQSVPVINGIFHITLVHNRGAAFGLLKGQLYLFMLASLGAIILIGLHLKQQRGKRLDLYTFSLTLILAGALGNLIDRAMFGHVIDFLDFRVWPVFNIADSAITVGAILLGWKICIRSSAK